MIIIDFLKEVIKYFSIVAGFICSPYFGVGVIILGIVYIPWILFFVIPATLVLYIAHLADKEKEEEYVDKPSSD